MAAIVAHTKFGTQRGSVQLTEMHTNECVPLFGGLVLSDRNYVKCLETRLQTALKVETLLCILLQRFLGVGVHCSNSCGIL